MAVEKGLFQAPKGVEEEETGQLEVEIVNPDMVTLDDGSMEITIVPDAEGVGTGAFDENLAENMEDDQLASVADELLGNIDSDLESRKEWADTFVRGLDVLGFKYEERTEPWEGACGVYSNVLAEACLLYTSPSPRDGLLSRMPSSA